MLSGTAINATTIVTLAFTLGINRIAKIGKNCKKRVDRSTGMCYTQRAGRFLAFLDGYSAVTHAANDTCAHQRNSSSRPCLSRVEFCFPT